ncbi:uncharacterized protein LOC135939466 [Cloeon dipterum]|uniref:uncharacterized protein LOC135939466 n=1 Tax=Cloeon dipterum TaxID=197152 RepID=UPI0032203CB3
MTKKQEHLADREEEERSHRFPPLLLLAVGGCLYFTIFWYVVWPPMADAWLERTPPLHAAVISLVWLTALLLWSLPLCCFVCWCAHRQRSRIGKAMLAKRQKHLADTRPQGVPFETNLCLVQPDGLLPKAPRSYPSVIIEEEDNNSQSESGSPASFRRDESSTKALYTGSSKRVSLMESGSQSGSVVLGERDIEEALKAVSVASSEDDVFHRGTIYVTPRTSFVLAIHEGPESPQSAQKDAIITEHPEREVSSEGDVDEESSDGIEVCKVPSEEEEVTQVVAEGSEATQQVPDARKVLTKQSSQVEFFVGGFRKESVTSEAIIKVTEDGIEHYTPGQFAILTSPEL